MILALPLVWAAVVDSRRPKHDGRHANWLGPARFGIVVVCALTFSLTLVGQSLGWNGLMDYAREDLARQSAPCVERHVAEKDGTAMRHWANPSLVLLVQGRKPRVVVVGEESSCGRLARTGELVIPRTGKLRNVFSHWFDLSAVRAALREASQTD